MKMFNYPNNRLTEKAFSNGAKSQYMYNVSNGYLQELSNYDTNGQTDRYQYTYDKAGNKTSITKDRRGLPLDSGVFDYAYDRLNRLTRVTHNGNQPAGQRSNARHALHLQRPQSTHPHRTHGRHNRAIHLRQARQHDA